MNEVRAYKLIAKMAERLETDVNALMDHLESMLHPELDDDELRLANSGKRTQAIKLYYSRTGCSLTDAKSIVDRVANPKVADFDSNVSTEELALAKQGNKIEAIKMYRNRTNCLLRHAKNAVDEAVRGTVEYTPEMDVSAVELETANNDNKIGAIKMIRERTGMGLRDAKTAIETAMGQWTK